MGLMRVHKIFCGAEVATLRRWEKKECSSKEHPRFAKSADAFWMIESMDLVLVKHEYFDATAGGWTLAKPEEDALAVWVLGASSFTSLKNDAKCSGEKWLKLMQGF